MGDLRLSFSRTNLDLENALPSGFFSADTITIYPALSTGTPTTSANPGAPLRYFQLYSPRPNRSYLDANPIGSAGLRLQTSFDKTNLDIEHPGVAGGIPYRTINDPTAYPALSSGTPTTSANPGAPSKFIHKYYSFNSYLALNPIGAGDLRLELSFDKTNLDLEDAGVAGGIPYNPLNDPTMYPAFNTGTPTVLSNPGFASKFLHPYNPGNIYLDSNPIRGLNLQLQTSFNKSTLDLELPQPYGFSAMQDITTQYPATVTGTPTYFANPGPFRNFNQIYSPISLFLKYIEDMRDNGTKFLRLGDPDIPYTIFDATNLDTEKPGVNGGVPYNDLKDPTVYPRYVTGIPEYISNTNPGPAKKFRQVWGSYYNRYYYDTVVAKGSKFFNLPFWDVAQEKKWDIFDVTNLDISKSAVDGGVPYNQLKDPTVYPATTTKRTPIRGRFATSGQPASKFTQSFNPTPFWGQTYMDFMRPYM